MVIYAIIGYLFPPMRLNYRQSKDVEMCGICGIFTPQLKKKPDGKLLDRSTDLMAHRGPDGRGTWVDPGIGLGHRRLAVIDPEGSSQPMIGADSRFVISYNGELYNFTDLRSELEKEGVKFRTRGDTEVVLEALARWGVKALERFNGMFALALWDRKEGKLLLARDRLGIKPLFYSDVKGRLVFASEFKPLFVWDWISRDPDPFGIAGFLSNFQVSLDNQTVFKDIKSLDGGHYVIANQDGIKVKKYWQLPLIPSAEKNRIWSRDRLEEARERLSELMRDAVKSHLVADVPVGAFLSGGIDSSIVITLMSEMYGSKVKAYSIGFDDAGFNEFKYSVPLVKELSLKHKLYKLGQTKYFPLMEKLIEHKMTPLSTPNEVPIWVLSRHLVKDIKVVLSGEGADELMGGYAPLLRSPHDFSAATLLRDNPGGIPADVRHAIRAGLRRQYARTGFKDISEHFMTVYSWVSEEDRREIMTGEFCNDSIEERIRQFWHDRLTRGANLSHYDKYLYILETEHLRGLLMRLDADTMAASVEGRVPFCDNRLVDFTWELPFNYKLRWKSQEHRRISLARNSVEIAEKLDISKYLLKHAFKNRIPQEIIKRKKKAFPVPLDAWMKDGYNDVVLDRLKSNPQLKSVLKTDKLEEWMKKTLSSSNGGLKVWMVLNLAIWMEKIAD